MKFLELANGSLLNVDKIKRFDYEYQEIRNKEHFYSYVFDDCGNKYDFLETETSFFDLHGKEHEIVVDHIITLHKLAAVEIMNAPENSLIELEALEYKIWNILAEMINKISENGCCACS